MLTSLDIELSLIDQSKTILSGLNDNVTTRSITEECYTVQKKTVWTDESSAAAGMTGLLGITATT